MTKICFVAQFPPPIHGLSKAVDTLYNSSQLSAYDTEKVDLTSNSNFFRNILAVIKSDADIFYLTISQSVFGNLRDLIFLAVICAKKKRIIVHLHGGFFGNLLNNIVSRWQLWLNKRLFAKVDAGIVLGDSLKSNFENMMPDNKIWTVANCVDDEFVPDDRAIQERFGKLSSECIFKVLYLSNFIVEKGYRKVLEMALFEKRRRADNGAPLFEFDFAGAFFDDIEKSYFFDFVSKHKLESIVRFHGIVKGKEKRELLCQSDIFILPTSYAKEGQPISIIEGMANGLFIVTTGHAGIPDIVSDNRNGIVTEGASFDEKEIYLRLVSTVSSLDSFIQVCNDNRHIALRNYSESNYINNMIDCFNWVRNYHC